MKNRREKFYIIDDKYDEKGDKNYYYVINDFIYTKY